MQRIAFISRLRPGAEEAYDKAHEAVWPEMLALLKRSGVSQFFIFRRDQLLFLTMEVEDLEATWKLVEADPVNTRWQASMAPLLGTPEPLRPGERFPMMAQVFYLA
jgi:L-rhamnose mutarotase